MRQLIANVTMSNPAFANTFVACRVYLLEPMEGGIAKN